MNVKTIDLGGDNFLTTGGICTGLHFADGSSNHFDLDTLGLMAEWIATAWENIAGEQYKPVVISERGYVADLGVQSGVSNADIPGFVDSVERLERDCE